jgi:hypothetical protein
MAHKPEIDFSPDEVRSRFEATLRGALKTPPQRKPAKPSRPKKADASSSRKAYASEGSDQH